jgi:hypothetical protein
MYLSSFTLLLFALPFYSSFSSSPGSSLSLSVSQVLKSPHARHAVEGAFLERELRAQPPPHARAFVVVRVFAQRPTPPTTPPSFKTSLSTRVVQRCSALFFFFVPTLAPVAVGRPCRGQVAASAPLRAAPREGAAQVGLKRRGDLVFCAAAVEG